MFLGVDVGGTFTDAALLGPDGSVSSAKVPSTPADQSAGVMHAIETVLATAGAAASDLQRLAHGMTVATNALLEGRGARTALIATAGFTDIIELGRQTRPRLYELCVANPPPLVPRELRLPAPERMTPEGPLQALAPEAAAALIERLAELRPEAVAVTLLHSYAHPEHEQMLGELIAMGLPQVHCSLSHELVGTFREYERSATTEVDAALSPLLASYLSRLSRRSSAMGLPRPEVMHSAGGLLDLSAAASHAALTVLSGPAGGVAGALLVAAEAGESEVLCFDMGGTSCDVCLIAAGEVAETAQRTVAGRPIALPAFDIQTVGAGGGSIAWRDAGGALRVGPDSAGAVPGPAAYGAGGQHATVTDANLMLGRLPGELVLAGGLRLDFAAAERAIGVLAGELGLDPIACAEGVVRVAEAEMLRALRTMTVERGVDPRRLAMMPFGGAGPLHAAALADRLGIERILCPRSCGVLSALGLAAAAPRRDVARTVMLAGDDLSQALLARSRAELIARARAQLAAGSDTPEQEVRVRVRYELRYAGQSFELPVLEHELGSADGDLHDRGLPDSHTPGAIDPETLRLRFAQAHEERYGYRDEEAEVELVTIRVSVWGAAPRARPGYPGKRQSTRTLGVREVVFGGRALQTQCFGGEPAPGTQFEGPAIWVFEESTMLVPPGWHGEIDPRGNVRLQRAS